MSNYRIYETVQFQKDLQRDFSGQKGKIHQKLISYVYPQLQLNPYYGKNIKKLVNYKPDTWRYRVGDYRFFYIIDERKKVVFMLTADARQNAY